jgi:hypothetical protein
MNATTTLAATPTTPLPVAGSTAASPALPGTTLPAPGAGVPLGTEPTLPITGAGIGSEVTIPLDAFAERAGPDVAVGSEGGLVRAHAVFRMDPVTKEMTVSVVDEGGRLIRMIPPDSVAKMITAMATYRGR